MVVATYRASRKLTYEEQLNLFAAAEADGLELTAALGAHGFKYDDLVYQSSESRRWIGVGPKKLGDFDRRPNGIPFVSFFTGCGGVDLGFEAVGFEHSAAFEYDERFCKTLRKNRPDWHVLGPPTSSGDVSDVEGTISQLEGIVGRHFDGVFIGGPPCQPFSVAASQRFTKDGGNYKRIGFSDDVDGGLLFDYAKLIEYFKPTCFVIENVPGLRTLDGGKQLGRMIERLSRLGYTVEEPTVVNSAAFGVPQFRERLFVVGARNGKRFAFPEGSDTFIGCGSVLPRDQGRLPNNETRTHKLDSVNRYSLLDYGQRDHLGRVDRLDPSLPAKTVIAGGTRGGGRSHLHPEIPRTLSVRECARLQTTTMCLWDRLSHTRACAALAGGTARQLETWCSASEVVEAVRVSWKPEHRSWVRPSWSKATRRVRSVIRAGYHASTCLRQARHCDARYRTAMFINGCFWHRHPKCRFTKTNLDYWSHKFQRNITRDKEAHGLATGRLEVWLCGSARRTDEELVKLLSTILPPRL